MVENPPATEPKRRSAGFPQVPLQEAIDLVVIAGLNGPEHTQDAFAAYLGHSTSNSGAFKAKLAALRDWGLIERGARDRVALSPLGQALALAVPRHHEERELLLTAFESCRIFGMLYGDSAKNMPMDHSRVRTTALMRYGVASDQADRFVDSFIKSAVFAGLAESDGARVTFLPRDRAFQGGGDDSAAPGEQPEQVPVRVAKSHESDFADKGTTAVALRQNWEIPGGALEFTIRTPQPLPPSIYRLVADMAEVAATMVKELTPPETPESSQGDED